jgi:hypothetical protein
MGLKKAAVARLCLNTDIYHAMPEVCAVYLPPAQPTGFSLFASSVPVTYAPAEEPYRGGAILLVEGKTGKDRLCADYDEARQRCRVWASGVTHHASKPKAKIVMGTVPIPAAKPSAKVETPPPVEITEGKSQ